MAFTPVHGSRGRVTSIVTTPDLTSPLPTLTALTQAPVNGITKWRMNLEAQAGDPIHHFEGTATTFGIIWGQEVQGGIMTATVDVEGYYDLDSSVGTIISFAPGAILVVDFVWNRAGTLPGLSNTVCKVMSLQFGPGIKDGPVTYTARMRVHSTVTEATTTTTAT